LLDTEPDGTLVLDVGGVGYEVHAPIGTGGRARTAEDGTVVLHVHTHAREDALLLFGFATREERSAFRALIGIARVGPKLAMAVLSVLSVAELADAAARGDCALLGRVPGVGKKTAERILLELGDKLAPLAAARKAPVPGPVPPRAQAGVVRDALVAMGYKPGEAERAVAAIADLDRPVEALLREALGLLVR
jgi:Holliday junction DNA helicase RuvA